MNDVRATGWGPIKVFGTREPRIKVPIERRAVRNSLVCRRGSAQTRLWITVFPSLIRHLYGPSSTSVFLPTSAGGSARPDGLGPKVSVKRYDWKAVMPAWLRAQPSTRCSAWRSTRRLFTIHNDPWHERAVRWPPKGDGDRRSGCRRGNHASAVEPLLHRAAGPAGHLAGRCRAGRAGRASLPADDRRHAQSAGRPRAVPIGQADIGQRRNAAAAGNAGRTAPCCRFGRRGSGGGLYGPLKTYADAGPACTITVLDLANGSYYGSLVGDWRVR